MPKAQPQTDPNPAKQAIPFAYQGKGHSASRSLYNPHDEKTSNIATSPSKNRPAPRIPNRPRQLENFDESNGEEGVYLNLNRDLTQEEASLLLPIHQAA
jgi:hypothetical protein